MLCRVQLGGAVQAVLQQLRAGEESEVGRARQFHGTYAIPAESGDHLPSSHLELRGMCFTRVAIQLLSSREAMQRQARKGAQ